jgi:NADH-quinone oxidoreductase subunit L
MIDYFWVIPLPLLITLIITLLIGKKAGGKVAIFGVIGALSSFLLSLAVLPQVIAGTTRDLVFTWFLDIKLGFILDPLTAVLLIVVSLLVTLITLYAYGYMQDEEGKVRFFAFVQIFAFAMLSVVLADNLLQAFISWEIMGLCSYLLIGFWFQKPSAASAAKKAFLTTRVGDVLMLIGILILYTNLHSFNYHEIFAAVGEGQISTYWLTLATLFIFGGVVGKSAQFPLHVWLPDAMEGPTPVSALIHAATMVKAGIYLVARLYPIYVLTPITLQTMAVIGTITALGAALMALVAKDFKQILAFSTLSQLGFMVVALGTLGYVAAILHLVNHAFFKALLFLGAGSAIHGTGTNNVWKMGGLFKYQKITAITMLLGTLSISGIPPFSGFWSKDEILISTFHNGHPLVFISLVTASFLTAFYMFRLYHLVFTGKKRTDYHAHEPHWSMLAPLVILGVLAVVSGFAGKPITLFLTGTELSHDGMLVMILSIIIAVLGVLASTMVYHRHKVSPQKIAAKLPTINKILANRYYIDDLYNGFCRIVIVGIAKIADFVDRNIIDGIIHLIRWVTLLAAKVAQLFDQYIVDGVINAIAFAAMLVGTVSRRFSTGHIQHYLLITILGLTSILFLIVGGIICITII